MTFGFEPRLFTLFLMFLICYAYGQYHCGKKTKVIQLFSRHSFLVWNHRESRRSKFLFFRAPLWFYQSVILLHKFNYVAATYIPSVFTWEQSPQMFLEGARLFCRINLADKSFTMSPDDQVCNFHSRRSELLHTNKELQSVESFLCGSHQFEYSTYITLVF